MAGVTFAESYQIIQMASRVERNPRIVAHWWNLCKSHLLRQKISAFSGLDITIVHDHKKSSLLYSSGQRVHLNQLHSASGNGNVLTARHQIKSNDPILQLVSKQFLCVMQNLHRHLQWAVHCTETICINSHLLWEGPNSICLSLSYLCFCVQWDNQ